MCVTSVSDICLNDGGSCANYHDNYLAWESPGIGKPVFFLFLQTILFFLLIFLFESGAFQAMIQLAVEGSSGSAPKTTTASDPSLRMTSPPVHGEDSDVKDERVRIASTELSSLNETDSIILMEIRKFYGSFLAVNRLSVGIPQRECFGLLGVNGAGKTTTFKMMTGDIPLSSGDAFLNGYSVKTHIKQVRSSNFQYEMLGKNKRAIFLNV